MREKAYICLFTCAATRAVHLELLRSLSTQEFLFAFRRFCSCYSVPEVIISDHGTNFKGCDNFLKQIAEEPEVRHHLDGLQIKWKNITAHSPWQGGFYERLIGVVKRSLNNAICRRKLSFVELQTLLCEVKTVVNSRPLTYVSDTLEDCYLTPNQLLYGRNILLAPPLNEFLRDDLPFQENLDLRSQYAKLSSAVKRFQDTWVRDYLTSLRERHFGNHPPEPEVCPLNVGDIVLVDLDGHRNLWPMGRVTKLYTGKDNKVRSVQVLIRGKLYDKPLSKLVHLELGRKEREDTIQNEQFECLPEPVANPPQVPKGRPVRAAARKAAHDRQELIDQGYL